MTDPLEILFSAYLGEDWREDYETWERAVDAFSAENPARLAAAIEACRAVLDASSDDAEVENALGSVGCGYRAPFFGTTYGEWLRAVIERLRGHAG